MTRYPSRIDGPALLASLAHLPRTKDGTGILMVCVQWGGHRGPLVELLADAVAEIELFLCSRVAHVMVNTIPPGVTSGVHSDSSPMDADSTPIRFNRWHLPLVTNRAAVLWDGEEHHLEAGYWHGPVRYWEPHYATNGGCEDRTHLVVSLWPLP